MNRQKSAMTTVEIHYRRPPDHVQVFEQMLVVDRPDCKVTLLESWDGDAPLEIHDRVALEPRAPIVWFVFPGAWHDLGRFHLRDGTFTGFYADIIAPTRPEGRSWEIRDLCLDLWIDREGRVSTLDHDELDHAVQSRWIEPGTARRARRELRTLATLARADRWPPEIARSFDLRAARAALEER